MMDALGIFQTVTGVTSAAADTEPIDNIGPELLASFEQADERAKRGLSQSEINAMLQQQESAKAAFERTGSETAVTQAGRLAIGRQANIDAMSGKLKIASLDEQQKRVNIADRDQLATGIENRRRQIFQDAQNSFIRNQEASAGLIKAGLENITGSTIDKEDEARSDENMKMFRDGFGSLNSKLDAQAMALKKSKANYESTKQN